MFSNFDEKVKNSLRSDKPALLPLTATSLVADLCGMRFLVTGSPLDGLYASFRSVTDLKDSATK